MGSYADHGSSRLRRVTLRDSRRAEGSRLHLDAELTPAGDLRLRGHDQGPVATRIDESGDYRYLHHIPARAVPEFLAHLGHPRDADVLEVLLARWSDEASYLLEERVRDFDGPHAFSTWE